MTENTKFRCDCSAEAVKSWFKENALMVATLAAVVLGVCLGLGLRTLAPSDDVIIWVGIWGELFLRMLKMIILPLIMCCLVVGVASMESGSSGKLGVITLLYIFLTQLISVIIGLLLAVLIKPGAGFGDLPPDGVTVEDTSYTDVFTDLFRNLFPENIVQACIQTAYTDVQRTLKEYSQLINTTEPPGGLNLTQEFIVTKKVLYRDGMNIMGIVVFSLFIGLATAAVGDAGKPLYRVFVSFNDVIMSVMRGVIWYSPIGIMSLIASALMKIENLESALSSVGLLIATVVSGCMIHQLIILPLLLGVICRRNPYKYFFGMMAAYLAGIAPPSSAVAMPYLLRICPEKLGIDKRVTQFVVPVCVTLNRDGSALFITVVAVFIAQSYAIALSVGQLIVLALLVSILVAAAAVVPSSSIVVLIMVSAAMGIPVEERIGLLMAVEWLQDRVRSGTNIVSHGYGCAIVHSIAKRFIPSLRHSPEENMEKDDELIKNTISDAYVPPGLLDEGHTNLSMIPEVNSLKNELSEADSLSTKSSISTKSSSEMRSIKTSNSVNGDLEQDGSISDGKYADLTRF